MNVKKISDVPYSQSHADRRIMDIFTPDQPNGSALMFIHGGGFNSGKKEAWHSVAEHFAAIGYVCACVEYRLCPQCKIPDIIHDVRIALLHFANQSSALGFSPTRIFTVGSSAGGYLALMLATISNDGGLATITEKCPLVIPAGAIAYCPVLSLKDEWNYSNSPWFPDFMPVAIEENPEMYCELSVPDRISRKMPAVLLMHGDIDPLISIDYSRKFRDIMTNAGANLEFHEIPGAEHGYAYGCTTKQQILSIRIIENFLVHN